MSDLNDIQNIVKFDNGNILESIRNLYNQIIFAWEETYSYQFPNDYNYLNNIIVSGMGGSALGGRIVDSLLFNNLRTPLEIISDYKVPNYVDSRTFFISSSYSGNTQENINSTIEAQKKGAKIFGITTGGELEEYFKKEELEYYKIDPKYNLSNQPRYALGYSIGSILGILSKCNYINWQQEIFENIKENIDTVVNDFDINATVDKNIAKSISIKLKDHIPVIVASEHLVGSAYAFKNHLNESSKSFSLMFEIPDLNHHLMEGLSNPFNARMLYKFIFIESNLYLSKNSQRYRVTEDVVSKNSVSYLIYNCVLNSKFEQAVEVLYLALFVSFYLAYLYGVDASKIPWVDYFKKTLNE